MLLEPLNIFFVLDLMYHLINCTYVTLILMVNYPTKPSQFRPIACCNVLYKLISKLLMLRLQKGMGEVINQSQTGFIPYRQLIENILLATKLVKGLGMGSMTPRCSVKIDLRKAYDSL